MIIAGTGIDIVENARIEIAMIGRISAIRISPKITLKGPEEKNIKPNT